MGAAKQSQSSAFGPSQSLGRAARLPRDSKAASVSILSTAHPIGMLLFAYLNSALDWKQLETHFGSRRAEQQKRARVVEET